MSRFFKRYHLSCQLNASTDLGLDKLQTEHPLGEVVIAPLPRLPDILEDGVEDLHPSSRAQTSRSLLPVHLQGCRLPARPGFLVRLHRQHLSRAVDMGFVRTPAFLTHL